MHRYRELDIWTKGKAFATIIYTLTAGFPTEERFGLTNQLSRASVSIPSNIAEGASRKSRKDFARFISIALGSAFEIDTQLGIALDIGYIYKENYDKVNEELQALIKMISRFHSTLSN